MLVDIINKGLVFGLVFAIVFLIKEIFSIVIAYRREETIEYSRNHKIGIGAAISYIMTIIFTGLL